LVVLFLFVIKSFTYEKKWFLYFFLAFVATNYAQSNNSQEKFIRVVKNKRYGLFNTQGKEILPLMYDDIFAGNKNGNEIRLRLDREEFILNNNTHKIQKNQITTMPYEQVSKFSEDLAVIKINGKCGYVDRLGNVVIEAIYTIANSFSEGLAMVALDNRKYGFIDKTGKIVIPLEYDNNYGFLNQFTLQSKNNKLGLMNASGKEITEFKYNNISTSSNGILTVKMGEKFGLIDKTGQEITPVKYDDIRFFVDSLAVVREGDKFSLINKAGREITPVKYDYIKFDRDSLGVVKKGIKYGYINQAGQLVIPLKYDYANDFSDGIAKVRSGEKFGLIDETEKEIINIKYNEINSFEWDLLPVKLNDKWGIINKKEQEITDFKFDKIITSSSPFFIVGIKDYNKIGKSQFLWGIINKDGKEITATRYLGVGELREDMIRVEYGKGGFEAHIDIDIVSILQIPGRWGFINAEGNEVIKPMYNNAKDFSEGLAAVQMIKNNRIRWGFIDKKNEVIIPLLYDRVQNFRNGFSMVELNGKWGLINQNGKIIIPIEYDEIDDFEFRPPYHDDFEMDVRTDWYDCQEH